MTDHIEWVRAQTDASLGRVLWDYNTLSDDISPADVVLVLGSNDLRVADYAAFLFEKNYAPWIVVSGGIAHTSDLLSTGWDRPEGDVFADRLMDLGVPRSSIIIESHAKNTGENITFTRKILMDKAIPIENGLLVQKPFMQRRALATATKQWGEIKWQVTAPNLSYQAYINKFGSDTFLNVLVGDTWRVIEYANLGFQTPQIMPDRVKHTLREMLCRGYLKHIPEHVVATGVFWDQF